MCNPHKSHIWLFLCHLLHFTINLGIGNVYKLNVNFLKKEIEIGNRKVSKGTKFWLYKMDKS